MGRRGDHSIEQIKEMALDAAETIVREQGYHHLSTRKIAKAIGYTVGTLYMVFENLDELILYLNGRTLDQLYEVIEPLVQRQDDPKRCIHEMTHTYLNFALQNRSRWNMVFEHRLPEGKDVPGWYPNKISELFNLLETPLRQLHQGESEQEIALKARVLWSSVHGICALALTHSLQHLGFDSPEPMIESLLKQNL